jgi:hypothetical protein
MKILNCLENADQAITVVKQHHVLVDCSSQGLTRLKVDNDKGLE